MSQLTEYAIRAAASEMSDGDKSLEAIKKSAIEHASNLLRGQFDSSNQKQQLISQENAISAAISVIKGAYSAVDQELKNVGHKRLAFDKERLRGIASFLIPSNIESRDLCPEQSAITEYVRIFESEATILRYMGIRSFSLNGKGVKGRFLSTLPFYQMSQFLPQPLASKKPSDQARRAIELFFKTQLPKFLGEINRDFDDNSKVRDVIASWRQGDNFLNDYRGPRFIIMSLGNLLWNLQHPVDYQTKLPLGLDDKINCCRLAILFINRLIDSNTQPDLSRFDYDGELLNYVRQIELHILELQNAYVEEKLQSLNMTEVTSRAHGTARILDDNIFKLIFQKDDMAATLASLVTFLNLLLKRDAGIVSAFAGIDLHLDVLNTPPRTVIDTLIIFFHLEKKQRKSIIKQLKESGIIGRKNFGETLDSIDKSFVRPIYRFCEKALSDGRFGNTVESAQYLAAERLMPLVGLAISDHRVEVDTEKTKKAAADGAVRQEKVLTGSEQLQAIKRMAFENEENLPGRYTWDLSSYLKLGHGLIDNLNELPRKQHKIGQFTELLDLLQNFIDQYKSFLLFPEFKQFVVRCLNAIGREFQLLKQLLLHLGQDINDDLTENRRLADTIRTMDQSLMDEIEKFTAIINGLEEHLGSPNFDKGLRQEIVGKLRDIDNQFSVAFGHHESGLHDFVEQLGPEPELALNERGFQPLPAPAEPDRAPSQHVLLLGHLIHQCKQAMSYYSRQGRKWTLLCELVDSLAAKQFISNNDIKQALHQVSRIVCAYRPGFFQAAYADTASAQILIKAVYNSFRDRRFPIAEILFGPDVLSHYHQSDEQAVFIRNKLSELKFHHEWASNSENLVAVDLGMRALI